MFSDKIDPVIYIGVADIGPKYLIPKVIGIVRWYCTYDERQLHTNKLNNIIHIPDSPVNIIIATASNEYMKDDDGTWILKRIK